MRPPPSFPRPRLASEHMATTSSPPPPPTHLLFPPTATPRHHLVPKLAKFSTTCCTPDSRRRIPTGLPLRRPLANTSARLFGRPSVPLHACINSATGHRMLLVAGPLYLLLPPSSTKDSTAHSRLDRSRPRGHAAPAPGLHTGCGFRAILPESPAGMTATLLRCPD
jgi:hypothetical protein